MTRSYNVFFSPKPGVDDGQLAMLCRSFLGRLQRERKISGFRLLKVVDPANFAGMPRFHLIVDCLSQEELDASFAFVKSDLAMSPHGELMTMVQDFRVTFTEDVS